MLRPVSNRAAASGGSHLSSRFPRVTTARVLVERNRFAEALAILRAHGPGSPGSDRRAVSPGPGRQSGGPRNADGLGDEQRLALLDEAIAAFRSILIRTAGFGARAPGTGPGLLSEEGGPVGA